MGKAVIPLDQFSKQVTNAIQVSQYRENADQYYGDPLTYLSYPVFNSFADLREVAGLLALNIHWKSLLSNILPSESDGLVCVIGNSFNDTFSDRFRNETN